MKICQIQKILSADMVKGRAFTTSISLICISMEVRQNALMFIPTHSIIYYTIRVSSTK